jgi:3-hydroxyacyl-CoA dehydrogenase
MIQRVAVIGTGVIGASWASNFLAHGVEVTAHDPAPGAEARLHATVAAQWPAMQAMGLAPGADPARLRFHASLEAALDGAEFVQENGPERLDAKQALFAAMAAATAADVVLASSSSTLMVSDVQPGCRFPERVVLGHPFNPPHLIPLVEVVGGKATSEAAIGTAMAFYRQIGKHPIRLNREMTGHVANRLQAALWQESFHLLQEGVASAADIDAAISHGPGLRWALLGPFLNLHLSGGPGGMAHMLAHLGPPTEAMWRDLGAVALSPALIETVTSAVAEEVAALSMAETVAQRDATLIALLKAKARAPALP